LQVDTSFLKDAFNSLGLAELRFSKTRMGECRALMHRAYAPTEEELQNEQFLTLNSDTSDLYGLLHARYIRSPEGKQEPDKIYREVTGV
jgi:casein kinase II subunit beta